MLMRLRVWFQVVTVSVKSTPELARIRWIQLCQFDPFPGRIRYGNY